MATVVDLPYRVVALRVVPLRVVALRVVALRVVPLRLWLIIHLTLCVPHRHVLEQQTRHDTDGSHQGASALDDPTIILSQSKSIPST